MDAVHTEVSKPCRDLERVNNCDNSMVILGVAALESVDAPVTSFNINRSKHVHIGPKYVTQNVTPSHVHQGRGSKRRCRSSVLVCVCWACIVASVLGALLVVHALTTHTRLDIGLNASWYLRRDDWQAMQPYKEIYLTLPVKYVIVGHSVTHPCHNNYDCMKIVIAIQQDHLRREFDDISPNFLVGGEGICLEGRGANVVGAMAYGWNFCSISFMFLGDYTIDRPDPVQFQRMQAVLEKLVQCGALASDYEVMGHCQVKPHTYSPGLHVMEQMHRFRNWNPKDAFTCLGFDQTNHTVYTHVALGGLACALARSASRTEIAACGGAALALLLCAALLLYVTAPAETQLPDIAPHEWLVTRDMWLAQAYEGSARAEPYPLRLVVINHSVSNECRRFISCAAELRNLQGYFLSSFHYDIPYNFIIGNDGRVYEGRGWGVEGAHTRSYNKCSMGIGFIGDYRESTSKTQVTDKQILRTQMLLEEGVRLGWLDPDYVVVGGRDIKPSESPGDILYHSLRTWPHYDPERYRRRTCEQIRNAQNTTRTAELK